MNNEPNKPIPAQELTDKELEGIAGGARDLATVTRKEVEVVKKGAVESGGGSFVFVPAADNPIIQVTAMCYQ